MKKVWKSVVSYLVVVVLCVMTTFSGYIPVGAVDIETETQTESETQSETEIQTEPETQSETEIKSELEKQSESEDSSEKESESKVKSNTGISKIGFKVVGDACVEIFYGITNFEDALRHKGIHKTFTGSYVVDAADVTSGKIWIYAQATGNRTFSGITIPENVTYSTVKSMSGLGGYQFLELDVSELEEDDDIVVSFNGLDIVSRAAGFNTSTTKKLTGLTFTWTGGFPSMYNSKPVTGTSDIWGNGTWSIPLPSISSLFTLFGVDNPGDARYTNVGRNGSGNINMRCTGVSNISDHSGLATGDAYVRCIDIDDEGDTAVYTFMVWAGNYPGMGQTTEGYFQIKFSTESELDIRFQKTAKKTSDKDILGKSKTANDLGSTKFRLYKLKAAGAEKIANDHKSSSQTASEWWAGVSTASEYQKALKYVQNLILSKNAKPDEESKNPNSDYFKFIDTYTTSANGKTDKVTVESGNTDYYIVFERKSPDGYNMGYDGHDGVPSGKHYYYKVFTMRNEKAYCLDAEGDIENDGVSVDIADSPLLTDIKLKKIFPEVPHDLFGHQWKDFTFLIADNANFTNAVEIALTGETTTIKNLWVGDTYYIKESPTSKATSDDFGFITDTTVYSFYPKENGDVVYSDTYPQNVGHPNAVDAYKHTYIGLGNGIENKPNKGWAQLIKVSSNPSISEGNMCYSLAGAEFKLTRMADGYVVPEKLITNELGVSQKIDLVVGEYKVEETYAPPGFVLDPTPKYVTVRKDQTERVNFKDEPANDPISILLRKVDSETGKGSAQGSASLQKAEYTVNYYDGYYNTKSELSGLTPKRTWVLATNENGVIVLRTATKVSGDDFYINEDGNRCIPLGTISIQETKAPEGYHLDPSIYISKITAEMGTGILVQAYNEPVSSEQVYRGDLRGLKISDDMKRMAGVLFRLTSMTTEESHVIVTNANGEFNTSSSWNLHSTNTNRGETDKDGIWFGELSELDDKKGALIYDSYLLEELPCKANEGKILFAPIVVVVSEDSNDREPVNLGTLTNKDEDTPEIGTTAVDRETGGHYGFANEITTIVDTVRYINLIVGREYRIEGILMDKETGEPLLIDGSKVIATKTFTPNKKAGSIDLEYTFDSSALKGKKVVVFEDLYVGNKKVASHADIEDEGQTVWYKDPKVKTTATDSATNEHDAYVNEMTTIVDVVEYKELIVGEEYRINGVLMDKETGRPLLIDGLEVTAEEVFVAEKKNGTVELKFTFNSMALKGKEVVVFEHLFYKEREIATHTDLEDKDQTVKFREPKIRTKAADKETGENSAYVNEVTTIIDTVSYTGLIIGKEYLIRGVLMDKKTGEPLLSNNNEITAEKTFVAETEDGTVDIEFTFNSLVLVGKKVVVFESLYYEKKEIAIHMDISDEDQTITFKEPKIRTTAVEKDSGKKEIAGSKTVTIVDTIKYQNLIIGKKYTVSGILMDKKTGNPIYVNGKKITSEKTFTATKANGSITVEFTFDASALGGTEIVVFEKLLYNNREIAVHEDLSDKNQTVKITEEAGKTPAPTTGKSGSSSSSLPKTGDNTQLLLYILLTLVSLAGVGGVWYRKRIKKS